MNIKYDVFVIGAGGTGSDFLRTASRFLSRNENSKKLSSLYIIDGDMVEEKNLSRQCFLPEDIGKMKADVLAEILGDNFDLKWLSYPKYLLSVDELLALLKSKSDSKTICIPILIGCVDNHACRKLLEQVFMQLSSCIYYDAANEFSSGQVVFCAKMNGKYLSMPRSYYFPDIFEGDMRNIEQMSCEELNNVSPQHILTNELAAISLATAFIELLTKGCVRNGILFFDMETMSSKFINSTDFKVPRKEVLECTPEAN